MCKKMPAMREFPLLISLLYITYLLSMKEKMFGSADGGGPKKMFFSTDY